MMQRQTVPLAVAAQRLRISYVVAYRRLMVGELEGERVGRAWMVFLDSLEAALTPQGAPQERQGGCTPAAA